MRELKLHGVQTLREFEQSHAHTPGPWAINPCLRWRVIDARGRMVGSVLNSDMLIGTVECDANARLIATAPDGYALARLILATNDVPEGEIRQAARELVMRVVNP